MNTGCNENEVMDSHGVALIADSKTIVSISAASGMMPNHGDLTGRAKKLAVSGSVAAFTVRTASREPIIKVNSRIKRVIDIAVGNVKSYEENSPVDPHASNATSHGVACIPARYQHAQKHRGPEQVELFLDGQRPGDRHMSNRLRSGDRSGVVGQIEK